MENKPSDSYKLFQIKFYEHTYLISSWNLTTKN